MLAYGRPERLSIDAHFFSQFTLSGGGVGVTEHDISSKKLTRLLAYIVFCHNKVCSTDEISEALWNNEDVHGPSGALKNLMYRLRTTLKKYWPDVDLILTGKGTYQWNPRVEIRTDVSEFEYLISEAAEADGDARIELLADAIDLYRGSFLENFSDEYWVVAYASYYKGLYLEAVRDLALAYEREGLYREMDHLCESALAVEPLDEEIHGLRVRALTGLGRYDEAIAHYRETERILYDVLGIYPSVHSREIYESLLSHMDHEETDLVNIQKELWETQQKGGAFLCEYGVFKKVYEIEARRLARMGMTIFIVLITVKSAVTDKGYPDSEEEIVARGMDELEEVIMGSLRSGDVCTRYSDEQFLIMLPGCGADNALMVQNRISSIYYKKEVHAPIELEMKQRELIVQ